MSCRWGNLTLAGCQASLLLMYGIFRYQVGSFTCWLYLLPLLVSKHSGALLKRSPVVPGLPLLHVRCNPLGSHTLQRECCTLSKNFMFRTCSSYTIWQRSPWSWLVPGTCSESYLLVEKFLYSTIGSGDHIVVEYVLASTLVLHTTLLLFLLSGGGAYTMTLHLARCWSLTSWRLSFSWESEGVKWRDLNGFSSSHTPTTQW